MHDFKPTYLHEIQLFIIAQYFLLYLNYFYTDGAFFPEYNRKHFHGKWILKYYFDLFRKWGLLL